MILVPLLALLLQPALAADVPSLYFSETVAATGWATGGLADTVVQVRAPVWRSDSVLFSDSYIGAGWRTGVTPAFIETGPRLSIKPIAIFDLHLEATHTSYFIERFGPIGFEEPGGETGKDQTLLFHDGQRFRSEGWAVMANPTFYMKVGPVVAMSSWTLSWISVKEPEGSTSPFVFEPYRGMVVSWKDTATQHLQALLYEHFDGVDGPMLRVGVAARGKYARVSPDVSLTVGGLIMVRPLEAERRAVPTFIGIVAPYVIDSDYVGGPPFMALLATWELDQPLRALK